MTKNAIIIVGDHASGKSRFIEHTLKPGLGMTPKQRHHSRKEKKICVKSQTLQEAHLLIAKLNQFRKFDILILPSWPHGHGSPTLSEIVSTLESLGFAIHQIQWQRNLDANSVRDQIIEILDS